MKFLTTFLISIVFLVFMIQGASALDRSFKDNIFDRSATVEATNPNTDLLFTQGSATYLTTVDGNSYWLTARHVVDSYSPFYVSGVYAYIFSRGNGEETEDWAILVTYGFDPGLEVTPLLFSDEFNKNREEGLYSDNLNKYRTITKMKVVEYGSELLYTTTYAQLGNSGSGVYNDDGDLVGLIIERTKEGKQGRTVVLLLQPDFFSSIP